MCKFNNDRIILTRKSFLKNIYFLLTCNSQPIKIFIPLISEEKTFLCPWILFYYIMEVILIKFHLLVVRIFFKLFESRLIVNLSWKIFNDWVVIIFKKKSFSVNWYFIKTRFTHPREEYSAKKKLSNLLQPQTNFFPYIIQNFTPSNSNVIQYQ